MIEYRTLNVRVEHLHEHSYEAIVQGPGGDGRVRFDIPVDMPDLEEVAVAVSRPRSARRRIETDESALAREFGRRLFDLVFQGTARDVMRMSLAEARKDEQGLRLMLELEGAPHLRNVPWELLWDNPKFVSTSAYTPIVRYVDLPVRPRPLEVTPPLRVLGMVSSPGDVRALDTAGERALLSEACGALDRKNLLAIDWVEEASLSGLLDRLNSGRYHIFHFIGHGDFDVSADDGVLLFEGPAGRSHRVTGTELGTILADHHTLRLAVINACEGARVAEDWGGIAGSLMQYGLPAVIAMQFEISDDAALSFARCLYSSVARNHPVDEALADARRGMFADGYGLEWATPVMFASVADCRLFDLRWEQAPAAPAKLSLSLAPDPAGARGGEDPAWRLELVNDGALELSELQPLAADGRPLSKPFSLGPGETRTVTWAGAADDGDEVVVTVAGMDGEGRIVSERTTATVPVRPAPEVERPRPKPAPRESAPAPPRQPAPPAPPPRRRRAPLVVAGIAAVGVVVALVAALSGGGGSASATIVDRIGMPDDASVLTANPKTALVSGDTSRLTAIDPQDNDTTPLDVDDLEGVPYPGAPEGRSIALSDTDIWVEHDSNTILRIPFDGKRLGKSIRQPVPDSSLHALAASRDAIWILSPDATQLDRIPAGSSESLWGPVPKHATQLAVTDDRGYVLYDKGDPYRQGIATVDANIDHAEPPEKGLNGSAIRTGDNFLMVLQGDKLRFVSSVPGGPKRRIPVGGGASHVDYNNGSIWVTYENDTLRRFHDTGEPAGDPVGLRGRPLAVDARDDRAWVLVATDAGKKELLDVRP